MLFPVACDDQRQFLSPLESLLLPSLRYERFYKHSANHVVAYELAWPGGSKVKSEVK
jgi:hypothetical protein